MGKKLIALVLCFIFMASAVRSAEVYGSGNNTYGNTPFTVLADGDARNIYYNNSLVYNDMNLYGKTLTANQITGASLDIKVAVEWGILSEWGDVTQVELTFTNTQVVDVSEKEAAQSGDYFYWTLQVKGYGTSSVLISINESDSFEIFRIEVTGEKETIDNEKEYYVPDKEYYEKEKKEDDWDSIWQEAQKHIPAVYIVDGNNTVVSGKTSKITVGESETYRVGIEASELNKNNVDFYFYYHEPYYFYLDTDRITWSSSGKHVTKTTSGQAAILQGTGAGEDTLKAEIPICVSLMYMAADPYSMLGGGILGGGLVYDQGVIYSEGDSWDVGKTGASAKIKVAEKQTPQTPKTLPNNPFKDIDISKVENPFSDISPKDWFYESVMYLYAAGILDGVDFGGQYVYYKGGNGLYAGRAQNPVYSIDVLSTDGAQKLASADIRQYSGFTSGPKFGQSNPMDRQNTVLELYNSHKAIGYTIGSYTINPFTDVKSGTNTYQPILWASENQIVKGYGGGLFGPYDPITREQFCTILVRHAKIAGINFKTDNAAKTFTDNSKISSWASSAVVTCQRAGIIQGYPDGSFKPQGVITNAEIATMIRNYLDQIPY